MDKARDQFLAGAPFATDEYRPGHSGKLFGLIEDSAEGTAFGDAFKSMHH